jgi:hypothetical protein
MDVEEFVLHLIMSKLSHRRKPRLKFSFTRSSMLSDFVVSDQYAFNLFGKSLSFRGQAARDMNIIP